MFIGAMEFDLLLGDVRSLKDKRAVLRPVLEALRRCDVSVAEVADHDLYRRARVGVAVTSGDAEHCGQVLDRCESWWGRWSVCGLLFLFALIATALLLLPGAV